MIKMVYIYQIHIPVTRPIKAAKKMALKMIDNNTSILNDDPYKVLVFSSVIFKTSGKLALQRSLSEQQALTYRCALRRLKKKKKKNVSFYVCILDELF